MTLRGQNNIAFLIITTVYILSRIIIFKGFNGTDDLHYAQLSADLLKGRFHFLMMCLQAAFY